MEMTLTEILFNFALATGIAVFFGTLAVTSGITLPV